MHRGAAAAARGAGKTGALGALCAAAGRVSQDRECHAAKCISDARGCRGKNKAIKPLDEKRECSHDAGGGKAIRSKTRNPEAIKEEPADLTT